MKNKTGAGIFCVLAFILSACQSDERTGMLSNEENTMTDISYTLDYAENNDENSIETVGINDHYYETLFGQGIFKWKDQLPYPAFVSEYLRNGTWNEVMSFNSMFDVMFVKDGYHEYVGDVYTFLSESNYQSAREFRRPTEEQPFEAGFDARVYILLVHEAGACTIEVRDSSGNILWETESPLEECAQFYLEFENWDCDNYVIVTDCSDEADKEILHYEPRVMIAVERGAIVTDNE